METSRNRPDDGDSVVGKIERFRRDDRRRRDDQRRRRTGDESSEGEQDGEAGRADGHRDPAPRADVADH